MVDKQVNLVITYNYQNVDSKTKLHWTNQVFHPVKSLGTSSDGYSTVVGVIDGIDSIISLNDDEGTVIIVYGDKTISLLEISRDYSKL